MKKFLVLLAAVFSINAHAAMNCSQSISQIGGLDDAVQQEMIIKCEQAKLTALKAEEAGVMTDATVQKVDKWSDISLKFAKAIGVAAKELGVAANEFIGTPAGKFTAAMIGWQVLGDDISGWAMFFLIWAILSSTLKIWLHVFMHKEYEDHVGWFGIKKKRSMKYTWKEMDDNQVVLTIIGIIVYIIVVAVVGVNVL